MSFETEEFKKLVGYPAEEVDQYLFSMNHAYKDFQRTLRGIGKIQERNKAKDEAEKEIASFAKDCECGKITSQNIFNKSHLLLSDKLISIYKTIGYNSFTYGQAQKWINMTMKYLYCFDERRFGETLPFMHIAVDSYVFNAVRSWKGFGQVQFIPWSKLSDYARYLKFQEWFRGLCEDLPLVGEFKLWRVERNNKVS